MQRILFLIFMVLIIVVTVGSFPVSGADWKTLSADTQVSLASGPEEEKEIERNSKSDDLEWHTLDLRPTASKTDLGKKDQPAVFFFSAQVAVILSACILLWSAFVARQNTKGKLMTPRFKLQLFVRADNSGAALAQLYKALQHHPYTDYELFIVNMDEKPESCERIRFTPTLRSILPNGQMIEQEGLDDISNIREKFGFKEHF